MRACFREFVLYSRLSESTVRRRVRDGTLLALQIGGKGKKLLFSPDAINRVGNTTSSAASDDTAVSSITTPSTGMPADTPSGPRPVGRGVCPGTPNNPVVEVEPMPKRTKYEHVTGRYFNWRLYQRPSGVWYGDGRGNDPDPGRHSLGTKEHAEALDAIRQLDLVRAVDLGIGRP